MNSKAQIVATLGPACSTKEVLLEMCNHQMDVARLNFSWGDTASFIPYIELVRDVEKEIGRHIPIMGDLSGPRIQEGQGHTYDKNIASSMTDRDREFVKFGVEQGLDYFAASFVGSARDVSACKDAIAASGGKQPVIAKIERAFALENLDEIIAATDAVMVARGDLGSEVPLERIPFVQADIIARSKKAGKPVITATQMMLTMKENATPTRAEVTDVANAILQGSDAVMLSDETTVGKHPVETVAMMEKIVLEAEKHMKSLSINSL
jgi:pyruvate kinase